MSNQKGLLPAAPQLSLPSANELRPEAIKAISDYSEALDKVDKISRDVQRLLGDLEIERRNNADLREALEKAKIEGDYYKGYAIEMRTNLSNIATLIVKAEQSALNKAHKNEEENQSSRLTLVEANTP